MEGIESELERRRSVVPRPMEYSRLPDGMLDDAVDAFEMGACRNLVDAIGNGSKSRGVDCRVWWFMETM